MFDNGVIFESYEWLIQFTYTCIIKKKKKEIGNIPCTNFFLCLIYFNVYYLYLIVLEMEIYLYQGNKNAKACFFIFKAQMDYFGKFNILLNVFEIAYHRWKKTPIAIETEQGRKKEIEKSLVVLKG